MSDDCALATHVVHLTEDLGIRAHFVDDGYWADRDRAELRSGRVVSVFRYSSTWDFQERHPTGAELVYVVEGGVELLLDSGDGERGAGLKRGEFGVIPAGSWHRVGIRTPATLLFVTPVPATTEHRAAPAG